MMIMATAFVQCMMRSGNGCSRRPCRVCDLTVARVIWKFFAIKVRSGAQVERRQLRGNAQPAQSSLAQMSVLKPGEAHDAKPVRDCRRCLDVHLGLAPRSRERRPLRIGCR